MTYMHAICAIVERKIILLLPTKFAIVFDGWSCGSTHFVSMFATFPSADSIGYSRLLLALAPINDEESLNADAHYEYLEFVLDLYGKQMSNIVALIGDNCSTNVAFARTVGVPLIGCASHRFNLFVSDILAVHEDVVQKVNRLMIRLSHTLPAARLRRLTHLAAKRRNLTRWSSTHSMLTRFNEFKHVLGDLGDITVDELRLNVLEEREIDALLVKLDDLNAICLALQDDECTMSDVRRMFDTVIEDYPDATRRLGENAEIVRAPCFESAVVKIQNGIEVAMSDEEAASITVLRLTNINVAQSGIPVTTVSLAQRALKKQKLSQSHGGYMDCRFLCPTSNLCERFFSSAKFAIGDRRCRMTPKNFEEQLFLRANSNLWSLEDVQEMMRSTEQ